MGQATQAVIVQHERANNPRPVRISTRVKRAIDHMVFEGLKRAAAAEKAGLTDNALYIALRKTDVLAYLNMQQQVLRTSAAARSIARVDNLADDSQSDHVKLEANKFLLGIEGVSPITKSENTSIIKNMTPGLTVNFIMGAPQQDDPRVIDGLARQPGLMIENSSLPQRVPHPSEGNGPDDAVQEAKSPGKAGRRK